MGASVGSDENLEKDGEMRLTIMLLTYSPDAKGPRSEYAVTTLRSTLDKLHFDGDVHVHIADDGSVPAHRKMLREIAGGYKHIKTIGETDAMRGGYGKSYNLATQALHHVDDAHYILPLEDDWELTVEYDVTPHVRALAEEAAGCVRLGYLGTTQELRGKIIHVAGETYLALDPDSPEPHVWAGHPRIETVQFQRAIGPWIEGRDPGSTEFEAAHRRGSRVGVVWPLYYNRAFAHIGTEQARTDQ